MILLVLYLLSLLGLVYFTWSQHQFLPTIQFDYFSTLDRTILFLLFLVIVGLYILFFIQPARVHRFSVKRFFYFVFPVVLVLAIKPPALSMDAISYLVYAKNFFTFGHNPFLVTLRQVHENSWIGPFFPRWWDGFTFPYGPVFLLLLAPVIWLSFGHLLTALLLYKFLLLTAYMGCIFLVVRLVKIYKLPESTILLFALNPALLIHGVLEAHNDLLILFCLLLAMYFFSSHWAKSFLFTTLGFIVKIIPGILFPAYVAHDRKIEWKRLLPATAIFLAVILISFAPFGFPFQAFIQNEIKQGSLGCLYQCSPIFRSIRWIFPGINLWVFRGLSMCLFLVIWYRYSWKSLKILEYTFWSLLVLFFVLSSAITPWYLLSVISIGILLSSRIHYRFLTLILLFYSFLNYFGI